MIKNCKIVLKIYYNVQGSTQIETVPEEPTGFIKLLKCLPQEQMIILKVKIMSFSRKGKMI